RCGAPVDRCHTDQSQHRQGDHPAVHGYRHLYRQLDAELDQPGDLGLGHHLGGHDYRVGGGDRRGRGDVGDARCVEVRRARARDAVTPTRTRAAKGATQQFPATGTYPASSTQNLTSQVTGASATTSVATITAAGLATGVAAGTSTISATMNGVTGSTVLTVTA